MQQFFVGLVFLLGVGWAQAQCPGDNSAEIRGCLEQANARAERQLNRAYQQALASLDRAQQDTAADTPADVPADVQALLKKSKQKLAAAQQAWKQFREADCAALDYAYTTGNGGDMAAADCRLRKTQHRIQELKKFGP
jgi:uncharacterized protein YecT (DUF1311 family)